MRMNEVAIICRNQSPRTGRYFGWSILFFGINIDGCCFFIRRAALVAFVWDIVKIVVVVNFKGFPFSLIEARSQVYDALAGVTGRVSVATVLPYCAKLGHHRKSNKATLQMSRIR